MKRGDFDSISARVEDGWGTPSDLTDRRSRECEEEHTLPRGDAWSLKHGPSCPERDRGLTTAGPTKDQYDFFAGFNDLSLARRQVFALHLTAGPDP